MGFVNRAELIERIQQAKSELDDTVERIPGDRMAEPGREGVWSPKDQLSHLAAWHEIVLQRIEGKPEEAFLDIPPDRYESMDIDAVNDFLQRRDERRTAEEAREAYERSFQEVVKALESVDEDGLYRDYRPEVRHRLLIDTIIGNTYEHYEEHLPMLRAFARS
jgi:hypothetical protein